MALAFIAEPCICTDIGDNEQWEYLLDTSILFTSPMSKYLELFVKERDSVTFTTTPSVKIFKGLVDGINHMYLVDETSEKT